MKLSRRANPQAGFTIIELMVATAIFSVILVIVTTGVISFSRSYYHGIINNNTQNITRAAVNELTQNIQFSAGEVSTLSPSPDGQTLGYCMNDRPYFYTLGRQLGGSGADGTNHVLVTADNSCNTLAVPDLQNLDFKNWPDATNPRELLAPHLRLVQFTNQPNATNDSVRVLGLKVAYGDADLLCLPTGATCDSLNATSTISKFTDSHLRCSSEAGSQYCAIASLTTNVAKRL